MSKKDRFIKDIGQPLYEKVKDYIIPQSDLQLEENIGSGFFADVYKAELGAFGTVAAKRKKGLCPWYSTAWVTMKHQFTSMGISCM